MKHNRNPEFLCSVADFHKAPSFHEAEFCILGRSNVGKSSFISHVLARRGLALVSKKPGKTKLANFFRVDEETVWVDMPGYGYARASQAEKKQWSRLLRLYCTQRENLVGGIWLLDIRHPGLAIDIAAQEWFRALKLPVFPVATKSDKLKAGKRAQNLALFKTRFGLDNPPLPYSVSVAGSRDAFWKTFDAWRQKFAVSSREN